MGALSGFRVLEWASGVAAEQCGRLLADFGAEVIKVEPPEGSPTRRLVPRVEEGEALESSGLFALLNAGKRSVVLDPQAPAARDAWERLLAAADVLVVDRNRAALAELALDPERLEARRPDLVAVAITPFGLDASLEAVDLNVFHASGWGYHTPSGRDNSAPPLKGPGRFLASYEAGLDGALCAVAALFDRLRTGRGRFVDVSAQAVLAARADYVLSPMVAGDLPVSRDRRAFDLAGPSGIFACREGWVYLWMSAPGHWRALGELMGRPPWMTDFPENWLERGCTPERVERVRRELARWLAGEDRHEVSERAQRLGLTMVPLHTAPDLLADPQYHHRGFFHRVRHPELGEVVHPGVPYRLSRTPAGPAGPAPRLGEDSDRWLAGEAL